MNADVTNALNEVVVVGAARTPIGSYGGSLSRVSATRLGSIAIQGALKKAGVRPCDVDACYMGNVCSAGLGQAPARQAAMGAGLPVSCVCTTVNKVCSSGLKTLSMAAQDIILGQANIVVAGGMENMSKIPFYVPQARFGYRIGDGQLVDGLLNDGLIDPDSQNHMGLCAEICSERHGITREMQDRHAKESYRRSRAAWEDRRFYSEVVPVVVSEGGRDLCVERDEECFRIDVSTMESLSACFIKDGSGTVTRGNASGLNDGAAALVLASRAKAVELGLSALVTIRGFADAEVEPEQFTTAPSLSIPKALKRAGRSMDEVDVFELNEAFSVVALANSMLLALPEEKVNLFGGAVSLGHPLGCSGARIAVTLLSVMKHTDSRVGVAGICNGGGGSTAMVFERASDTK
ncbi:acetyl-CoA acetyltransferase [Gracilaria domingensis]|nr:acetyl-CoA acetyltransferase [Gracilaria domingensis]